MFSTFTSKFRTALLLLLTLGLVAATAPWVMAQSTTGTLTGTVADSSGAVIPHANVTLTNEASGDVRRVVSNSEGFFTFSAVQPATYTVAIEAKGFEKWQKTGVGFNPGDKRNLSDIALVIGSASETVTVASSVDAITPVDSGEKASVIGQKQLQNVSIVGRNAAEFIKILPGFAITGGLSNSAFDGQTQGTNSGPIGSFSANGQRTGALDMTVDGAHVIDPGCNCGQAVNANADMTQEVKVMTSNFGAENQKGPIVISSVGKAGGRDFHGEAYLYARHNALNANDWQNNQARQPKPATSYFYPGGSLSGPILLPFTHFNRSRDKLFFFVGYELYKQVIDNGFYRAFVPTPEMKAGNFSKAYLDSVQGSGYIGYNVNSPATNTHAGYPSFPGGIIPQSAIDPRGLALMNLYPAPNVDPKTNNGFNYITSGTKQQDSYQLHPRVDWSISENTKLYVSYNRQRDTAHYTDTLWWRPDPTVPYPTPLDALNESDSVSVNLTHVFSPTLTNEFVGTYTYLNLPNSFHDPKKVDPAALGINYQTIFKSGIKELPTITGWGGGVANIIQPSGFQLTGSLYAKKTLPTIADNVSKVFGTHILKGGFYWEATNNDQPSSNNANGQMQFASWGANSTGNAYADMLTGRIAGYSESNKDVFNKMQYRSVAFYASDSWKATRRLTLDFGIRFDHLGPWNDLDNLGLAVFDPSKYSDNKADVNKLTGVLWHAIDHSVPVSGSQGRLMFYSPRGGFAYDIFGTGKTVVRGGYGVYRFHDEQNVQASALNIGHGSYNYSTPSATTFDQIAAIQASFVAPGGINVVQRHDSEQPRTQSYSFTVSQKTFFSSLFEVSYVGNKSDYLSNWNNNFGQLNLIPYGTMFGAITADNLGPDKTPFLKYHNYQTIKEIQHVMYSNYNSLQASWNKQSGHVNYLLNYTFSKALGIRGEGGSPTGDPLNLKNDYGVLPNDRTHIFNIAYVINLPDPAHSNVLAKAVANGWQISGISQFQSGANLQGVASSNFNLGGQLPAGTTIPGTGVVLNAGAGISPIVINGSPDINAQPVLTCDPRKGLSDHQFVNGNCFALPTPGHNGAFIFPYLKGPAYFNNDLSAFKNFNFSETRKLQLRFSAYNFLNHPLTTFIGGDNNLSLSIDPKTGKPSNSRFGYADYKIGHRIIQLAVKFYF